jgi:hypothetical protein
MLRYVGVAVIALVLLGLALRSRTGPGATPATPHGARPVVRIDTGPAGRTVTVSLALRGSVTRASLLYDLDGEEQTAAVETDCRRGRSKAVTDDGYATTVELTGPLPEGASRLRLVVESETGTEEHPIQP